MEEMIKIMMNDQALSAADRIGILTTQIGNWSDAIEGKVISPDDIEGFTIHMKQLRMLEAALEKLTGETI